MTVPTVYVPVPGVGQTIVYVPPLRLRSSGDQVVGIGQMLLEHGLEESTFIRPDGSSKPWSEWSDAERWKLWAVIGGVRESLMGAIGDFMKVQVVGFDNCPRHQLAKASGWHLHQGIGESCIQSVVRPLLDDSRPVSALQLALHGDFVSILVRDLKSPSGVTLSTVGVGQHAPQPFGKVVIHDDLLADATSRAAQLSRSLNPDSGLPFRLVFRADFVSNVDTAATVGEDVPDESEGDGATERSYNVTAPESAVVDESDLIDVKDGPESCARAIAQLLSVPIGHPHVVNMMKIVGLVTEEVSAPIIVHGASSSASVPVAIISNSGSPPSRPTRAAPPPPVPEE
jgi:hypothetical protein